MIRCGGVAEVVEGLAPAAWAAEWDNVGLLVGDADTPLQTCLVALDCDARTVALAKTENAQLIVCHHPVIFHPLKRLDPHHPAVQAAAAGIAVYAAHTNLDVAPGGVNDALAAALRVEVEDVLEETGRERLYKLVSYVPEGHLDSVRQALAAAGAGHLGNYDECSFASPGTGTFRPLHGADPFIGHVGELERAAEHRLEMLVPERIREGTIKALLAAHPYEEVAYDLVPLANEGPVRGFGRIGKLADGPVPLREFARHVGERLSCAATLRWLGDPERVVARVALCGGSGADFVAAALRAGADAYVTGDVKYHEAREAAATGLGLIDAGHFATEQPIVPVLARLLATALPRIRVVADAGASDVWQGGL